MRVWMQIDSGPHEGRNTEGAHFTHGCIPATVAVLWSFHLYTAQTKKIPQIDDLREKSWHLQPESNWC